MRFLLMTFAISFGLFLEAATTSVVSKIKEVRKMEGIKQIEIKLQNGTALRVDSHNGEELYQKLERARDKQLPMEFSWDDKQEITSLKTLDI